jgi:hypothetical protein
MKVERRSVVARRRLNTSRAAQQQISGLHNDPLDAPAAAVRLRRHAVELPARAE